MNAHATAFHIPDCANAFPPWSAAPIARLHAQRTLEAESLRIAIRQWKEHHGFIMRPYFRDRARAHIKAIRAIDSNTQSWREK